MLISYNWLKSYIKDVPEVDKLSDVITFHLCELESVEKLQNGDAIFDLKILPDRAHDLLSHRGVAYEIAGLLCLKVFENPINEINSSKTNLQIEIQTPSCKRYMGRIVRNIKVGPSPKWMVEYLESLGQRSINNIVDATNIILFGIGQPIHAFDLKKLEGEKIVVQNAKEGDELELVGSEKIKAKLKESDMMITDGVKSLAIAGVKGGLDSGINNDTKDILIEVANFDAISVRKTARRLSIQTDASKRYENVLSPILCELAMKEISNLILELCPESSFEEVVDIYKDVQNTKKVSFTGSYISKSLGINIPKEEIEKILKNYNYEFTVDDDSWEITVPSMRIDITRACDMVEEIGRVYGYDKITPKLPVVNSDIKDSNTWTKICLVKQKLIDDGYKEVMNYALTQKGDLQILSSASDKGYLVTTLSDGLKKSYELNKNNLALLEGSEVKIFEVGTVFLKSGEEIHVACGDKKGIIEVKLEDFNLDQKNYILNAETGNFKINGSGVNLVFKSWSLYPFITRDISVWVPEGTEPDALFNIYKELGTDLLVKNPMLVDKFQKGDKISYAYRLVFQSYEKTLKDEEINPIMEKINTKISSLGWEVR